MTLPKPDDAYEKSWETDATALREYDEANVGDTGPTEQQNPRYLLAPTYFDDYLVNRPSERAGRSLYRGFRMWGRLSGVSDLVRDALGQITGEEEFDWDTWDGLSDGVVGAFLNDEHLADGLDLLDSFSRRIASNRGMGILLVRVGEHWVRLGNGERAKRNFETALQLNHDDCPWYVANLAEGGLYEYEHLNIGQKAPHFSVEDINGNVVDIGDYADRVVLLDFWSSTCGPCHGEFASLRDMAIRYPKDRFAIVGVSLDEDVEALRKCIETERLDWPHICEGGGWWDPLAKLFNITSIPTTYILAQGAVILGKRKRGDEIREMLDDAIFDDGDGGLVGV